MEVHDWETNLWGAKLHVTIGLQRGAAVDTGIEDPVKTSQLSSTLLLTPVLGKVLTIISQESVPSGVA